MLLAVASAPLAVACTTPPPQPPPPDPLAELVRAARADSALASAVGANEVASARAEHAERLQAEVDRAAPAVPSASAAPSGTPPVSPPPNPTREQLVAALQAAQKQAGELLPSLPTHRAGLVGSVSAGCASLLEAMR
ncbi:hypothetical protein GCM10010185_20510 [Saccharothrix coeruleofusca]|uniref:Uncharacterized protein n=1 Tax=Saccharothrix coeruleofusca TaxID=33919 RepID=A0A918AK85_9PSEU|nr:hypothetical protein GCM10010185_20510 [Saccharothrix coeruleofusca]